MAYVAIIHIYLKNSSHSRHEEACKDKMAYVAIIHMYLKNSILIQGMETGEACKDKIVPGKTLRSVSLRGYTYFANISAKTNFFEKPF